MTIELEGIKSQYDYIYNKFIENYKTWKYNKIGYNLNENNA